MNALLLDLDDTLLDYSGGVDESWREACATCCAPLGCIPGGQSGATRSAWA